MEIKVRVLIIKKNWKNLFWTSFRSEYDYICTEIDWLNVDCEIKDLNWCFFANWRNDLEAIQEERTLDI